MRRTWLVGLVVVLAAVLLGTGPAAAGDDARPISMRDNHYLPSTAAIAIGQRIEFQNFGMVVHDARDLSGLDAFHTDILGSGESETVGPLPGAGTYRYYCTFHPEMVGTLRVPPTFSRPTVPAGAAVTVRWSHRRAATGLVYDVQRRKPGTSHFVDWRTGVTAAAANMSPVVRGVWTFRARVRTADGAEDSDWSPTRTIRVT